MSKEAYAHALPVGPAKPGKKVLSHLRIYQAENGGHMVEHHFESSGSSYHGPEQHVFGKGEGKKMLAHVKQHMGVSDNDGDE